MAYLVREIVLPDLKENQDSKPTEAETETDNKAESEDTDLVATFNEMEVEKKQSSDNAVANKDTEGSLLDVRKLGELLDRATSVVTTDAKLWDVAGLYHLGVGNVARAIECYLAECRALQVGGWQSDPAAFAELAAAVVNAGKAFMMIPGRWV